MVSRYYYIGYAKAASVILFPFMALGLFLGMKGSSFLDEKKIKKLVIIMLILSGVSLIVTLF